MASSSGFAGWGCRFGWTVSGHSTDSPNVVKEVMLASESGKVILPVYLEEAEIPSRLKYQLTGIQHLEAFALSESGLIDELRRGLAINGVTVPGIETSSTVAPAKPPSHRRKKKGNSTRLLPLAVGCLIGVLIGWFAVGSGSRRTEISPTLTTVYASISLPETAPLADASVIQYGASRPNIAMASDGSFFVYAAKNRMSTMLYKRKLDQDSVEAINGTEGGFAPFLSPDNQWVAFIADNKLKKVSLSGGSPQILTDAPHSVGGTWADDGLIYCTTNEAAEIFSINEN